MTEQDEDTRVDGQPTGCVTLPQRAKESHAAIL